MSFHTGQLLELGLYAWESISMDRSRHSHFEQIFCCLVLTWPNFIQRSNAQQLSVWSIQKRSYPRLGTSVNIQVPVLFHN